MRKLIKDRLTEIWCDELADEHDISELEMSNLSDEELLDLYDEVFGYQG